MKPVTVIIKKSKTKTGYHFDSKFNLIKYIKY